MFRAMAASAILSSVAFTVSAQPGGPPPCTSADHRAFDFWVGTWSVFPTANPSRQAGTNRIEKAHGDCVLIETWIGAGGVSGTSLNMFSGGRWHQTWMSNGGMLVMSGGPAEGAMSLQSAEGSTWGGPDPAIDRITWTPNRNGTVRQHGERSTDGGKTWTTSFDLTYRRAAP